jgi:hypothetical protein
MKSIAYLVTACFVLAALPGCSSEPRSVMTHKPGVYKGAPDPLLALKNQQALIDRFQLVQTDR